MRELDKAFDDLISSINAQISFLNKKGYKIHDAENLECFVSGIRYYSEDNFIKVDVEEEK